MTSDADGNTLTDTSGRTMTWDSQNRMTSCTFQGTTSTFTYGADGLRRSSTVSGVTTYYAYDGQTLVREMHKNLSTGALYNTATYLTGPRGPEYRRDDTATELDSQNRQVSKCRWYVYDCLGSVVGEVDPSGNLTSSPKYDVYGLVRSNPGTASSAMGFVGGLGHLSEAGTGLIYMRARYYDPALGRFCSEDPSMNGSNWFIYCSDNPVNRVDASGKVDVTNGQIKALALDIVIMCISWMYCPAFRMLGYGIALQMLFNITNFFYVKEDGKFLGKEILEDTDKNVTTAMKNPGVAEGPIAQETLFWAGYAALLDTVMTVMEIEADNGVNILPF